MFRLKLLGSCQIEYVRPDGTVQDIIFPARKTTALFCYLMRHRTLSHRRETLATLLWGDKPQKKARQSLATAIWHLRKSLPLADLLLVTPTEIEVNPQKSCWLDVEAFAEKASRSKIKALSEAAALYHGPFLPMFYDDWVLAERYRLQTMFVEVLGQAAQHYHLAKEYDRAIQLALRLIEHEPLTEIGYEIAIRSYAATGRMPAALAQYTLLKKLLKEELDAEPSSQLQTLVNRLNERPEKEADRLPAATTRFFGRQQELIDLVTATRESDGQIFTIIGPGGVGKTRLAIELAHRLKTDFAGGVYFVSAASAHNAEELARHIGDDLTIETNHTGSLWEEIAHDLATRPPLLLILDNLEQITSDISPLGDLVKKLPQLKIIATSRQRVPLQASQHFQLKGLVEPESEQAATELFVNRARRVNQQFKPSTTDMAAIQEISLLVEGLPLAIELAAAWVNVLTPAEIAAELKKNLAVLKTNTADLEARHRSLHSVFEQSWESLNPREQAALAKLAYFANGFTRAAAQQVADASLMLLASLADRSLISLDVSGRYVMHSYVQSFARHKLRQHRWQAAVRRHHARFFASLCAELGSKLDSADQHTALNTIDRELGNIRLAWDWAVRQADFELLDPLIEACHQFFIRRTRHRDGTALFSKAIRRFSRSNRDASVKCMLQLRSYRGQMFFYLGDYQAAAADLNWVVNHKAAEPELSAHAHLSLAAIAISRSRVREAIDGGQKALGAFAAIADEAGQMRAHNLLGVAHMEAEEWDNAVVHLQKGIRLARANKDTYRLSGLLNNLGLTWLRQDQLIRAETPFREALSLMEASQQKHGLAFIYGNLGYIAYQKGHIHTAVEKLATAVQLHEEDGNLRGEAQTQMNLGLALMEAGELPAAEKALQRSLDLSQQLGLSWTEAYAQKGTGTLLSRQGYYPAALEHFRVARALFQKLAVSRGLINTILAHAYAAQEHDHPDQQQLWHELLMMARTENLPIFEAIAQQNLGVMAAGAGDFARAEALLSASESVLITTEQELERAEVILAEARIASLREDWHLAIGKYAAALRHTIALGNWHHTTAILASLVSLPPQTAIDSFFNTKAVAKTLLTASFVSVPTKRRLRKWIDHPGQSLTSSSAKTLLLEQAQQFLKHF